MGRRGGTYSFRCAETGCTESGFTDWDNQREYAEAARIYANWRCYRHRNPEQMLGLNNTARHHVLVARPGSRSPDHLFWAEEGAESGSMGLVSGPGFKAHANDFPAGTRLVVTAYVETPEQAEIAATVDGA